MQNKIDKMDMIALYEHDVQRARLRIDVIKWQASKEMPKKYGDRPPIEVNVTESEINNMTIDEIKAQLAKM